MIFVPTPSPPDSPITIDLTATERHMLTIAVLVILHNAWVIGAAGNSVEIDELESVLSKLL